MPPLGWPRRGSPILREAIVISLMIIGVLAARSTLADHYLVPSGSMEHTLYPGDRVFVDKLAYGLRIPFTNIDIAAGDPVQRGDVVVFDSPADGTRLIKRVVAVGGDRVVIKDGQLSINGVAMHDRESRAVELFAGKAVHLNLGSGGGPDLDQPVPPNSLLAIGDHRGNSKDSRYFGWVSESSVYGKARGVYYRSGEGFTWKPL